VLTPDVNGGFTPAVQIEEHEKKNSDGTIDSKKSTLFSDGAGHWRVGEVREGTSKQENGQPRSKEERVLRSDLNGKLAIEERTVSKETEVGAGEKHESVETYSVNVPGSAGDGSLHLVSHEATVRKNTAASERTVRQVERTNPGAPTGGLHVTDEVIDIVRPGTGGVSQQKRTTLTLNSAGRLGEVWVDVGKTDRPLQVDTRTSAKPQ
jgi:hypothetical protein